MLRTPKKQHDTKLLEPLSAGGVHSHRLPPHEVDGLVLVFQKSVMLEASTNLSKQVQKLENVRAVKGCLHL
jgi:hypothetical protein